MTTPAQTTPFPLRMPPELRERLEARAKSNGRSANSEIVAMVTAMLDTTSPDLVSVPAGVLLEEVIARFGARKVQIVIENSPAGETGTGPAA